MHFIVSSSVLLKNLQVVGGIISSNVILPILEDFLFELDKNTLTLTGSDLETMIKVKLEVQTDGGDAENKGKICIPSKILLEYLKNLPEQPVRFTINPQDQTLEIKSNTGKYKIGGQKADEYPKEPAADETGSVKLPSKVLQDAIASTIYATSSDTLRPAMTGVYFELGGTQTTFVATDAQRLVRLTRNDLKCDIEKGFIVPRKPLQQLKNIIPSDDSQLDILFNDSHLFVNSNNLSMSCRLIDAKFPPYKSVIPQDNPFNLTINRAELISCLRRVSVFASKGSSQVVFNIQGNTVSISAQDADFSYEGKEELNCQYQGEDMKIAFNGKLLVEMLSNLVSEEVRLELSTPSRAGIFKPVGEEENEDLLQLLMPLMVGA